MTSHIKKGDVLKISIPTFPRYRFFKVVEITKVWKSNFGKTFTDCLCEELGKYKRNEEIFKDTFSDSDNWKVSEEEANNYLPRR